MIAKMESVFLSKPQVKSSTKRMTASWDVWRPMDLGGGVSCTDITRLGLLSKKLIDR